MMMKREGLSLCVLVFIFFFLDGWPQISNIHSVGGRKRRCSSVHPSVPSSSPSRSHCGRMGWLKPTIVFSSDSWYGPTVYEPQWDTFSLTRPAAVSHPVSHFTFVCVCVYKRANDPFSFSFLVDFLEVDWLDGICWVPSRRSRFRAHISQSDRTQSSVQGRCECERPH